MSLRIVVMAAVVASSVASAQMLVDQGPPQHRLVHKETFAVRLNPLGLVYDGRYAYRFRLYASESKALRDNFLGIGVAPMVSPANLRIGPYVEFNPATIFGVWAMVQFVQYFGTFNLAQGFAGAQSDFSDTALRVNAANHRVTNGWEATLGANFQVKVSVMLLRTQTKMIYGDLKLNDSERIYYEQIYDTGSPNKGWTFTNDVDVLYQGLENKLVAGARYTFTAPLYDPTRHFDPDALVQSADNSMHRLGPFIGYTFKFEDGAKFNTPTVFILVQWWLKHRFRDGVDSPAALPLLGLGFQMTGDFLPVK